MQAERSNPTLKIMSTVLPGEIVPASRRYGPGIMDQHVLVAGELENSHNIPFIDTNSKRYQPATKDLVIGTITMRGGDFYRVSLQPYRQGRWIRPAEGG